QVAQTALVIHNQRSGRPPSAQEDWQLAEQASRRERTALRAFLLSQRRGHIPGHEREDWLAAEAAESFTDAAVRAIRRHFIDHVRACGPLPALRVGDQPYGVLPVLALDAWQPVHPDDPHPHLVHLLRSFRDHVWLPSALSEQVPRIGLLDPSRDRPSLMLQILGLAPTGQEVYARSALGPEFFANLDRFAWPELQLEGTWRHGL